VLRKKLNKSCFPSCFNCCCKRCNLSFIKVF
jgi:hypothetical protein